MSSTAPEGSVPDADGLPTDGEAGIATHDASAPPDGGDAGTDAGIDAAACQQLAAAASTAFRPALNANGPCHSDSDCIVVNPPSGAWCVAPCDIVTSEAGAAAVVDAAVAACEPVLAAGCGVAAASCPRTPNLICSASACTGWDVYVTQVSASLEHGACATFAVNYLQTNSAAVGPATPADAGAPHDLAVTLLADGNTVYSDTACTTPASLTDAGCTDAASLTIPAGANSVQFSVLPPEAGTLHLTANCGALFSFIAQ